MLKKRMFGLLGAAVLAAGPAVMVASSSAMAAGPCVHGIVGSRLGDKAYGSCASFDRSAQQARVTADCVAGPDRNTSWFHDYNTHTTGACGTFGLTGRARASIVSFRY